MGQTYYLSELIEKNGFNDATIAEAKRLKDAGNTVVYDAESVLQRVKDTNKAKLILRDLTQKGYKVQINAQSFRNYFKQDAPMVEQSAKSLGWNIYNQKPQELNAPIAAGHYSDQEIKDAILAYDIKPGHGDIAHYQGPSMRAATAEEAKPVMQPVRPVDTERWVQGQNMLQPTESAPLRIEPERGVLGRAGQRTADVLMAPMGAGLRTVLMPERYLQASRSVLNVLSNSTYMALDAMGLGKHEYQSWWDANSKSLDEDIGKIAAPIDDYLTVMWREPIVALGLIGAASRTIVDMATTPFTSEQRGAELAGSNVSKSPLTATIIDPIGSAFESVGGLAANTYIAMGGSPEVADKLRGIGTAAVLAAFHYGSAKRIDVIRKKIANGESLTPQEQKVVDAVAPGQKKSIIDKVLERFGKAAEKNAEVIKATTIAQTAQRTPAQKNAAFDEWLDLTTKPQPVAKPAEVAPPVPTTYGPPPPKLGSAEDRAQTFLDRIYAADSPQAKHDAIEAARSFVAQMPAGRAQQMLIENLQEIDQARTSAQYAGRPPKVRETELFRQNYYEKYQTPQDVINDVLAGRLSQQEGAQIIGELRAGRQPMRPTQATPMPDIRPQEVPNAQEMQRQEAVRPIIAYHGTKAEFPESQFRTTEDSLVPDRLVGPHFAADKSVADTFAKGEGGTVKSVQLDIRNPREIPQPVNSDGIMMSDQRSFQADMARLVFPRRKDLFVKIYSESRKLPPEEVSAIYDRIIRGEDSGNSMLRPSSEGLYKDPFADIAANYGMLLWDNKLQKEFTTEYRKALKEQGYDGVKYQNTSPMETANATDKTAYIPLSNEQIKPYQEVANAQGIRENAGEVPVGGIDAQGRAAEGAADLQRQAQVPASNAPEAQVTHTMPTGETMPGAEHPGAVPGTTRPVERTFTDKKGETWTEDDYNSAIAYKAPVPPEVKAHFEQSISDAMRAKADALEQSAQQDLNNARKGGTRLGAGLGGVDPNLIKADTKQLAATMLRGGARAIDFATWSKQMLDKYGPEIDPMLPQMWADALNMSKTMGGPVKPPSTPGQEKQGEVPLGEPLKQFGSLEPPSKDNVISMFQNDPSTGQKLEHAVMGRGQLLPGESKTQYVVGRLAEQATDDYYRVAVANELAAQARGLVRAEKAKPGDKILSPLKDITNAINTQLIGHANRMSVMLKTGLRHPETNEVMSPAVADIFKPIEDLGRGDKTATVNLLNDWARYITAKGTLDEIEIPRRHMEAKIAEIQANTKLNADQKANDIRLAQQEYNKEVTEFNKKNIENRISGMGQEQGLSDTTRAQQIVNEIAQDPAKQAAFDQANRTYKQIADALVDYSVISGRMDKATGERIKNSRDVYSSFKRWYEDNLGEPFFQSGGGRVGQSKNPFQRRKGSARPIEPPVLSLVQAISNVTKEADRSIANTAFFDNMLEAAKKDPRWNQVVEDVTGKPNQGTTHKVYRDGKLFEYKVHDPVLSRQLSGLNEGMKADSDFSLAARAVAKWQKNSIILDPFFALRNFQKATFEYPVGSKHITWAGQAIKGAFDVARPSKAKDVEQANLAGLGSQYYMKSRKQYLKFLRKQLQSLRGDPKTIIWDGTSKYQKFLGFSEFGPRFAAYEKAKKYAQDKLGLNEMEASRYAAEHGADLPNFFRAGKLGRMINQYIPFVNPNIQSKVMLYKAWKNNPGSTAAKFSMGYVLPRVLEFVWNSSDERRKKFWQETEGWKRAVGLNFYLNDGTDLFIPIGFEMAAVSNLVDRSLDAAINKNPNAYSGLLPSTEPEFEPGALVKQLTPADLDIVLTSWASIPFEMKSKYEYFQDRYYIPQGEQDLDVSLRSGARFASPIAKFIAQNKLDPREIDHIISKLGGGFGKFAINVSKGAAGDQSLLPSLSGGYLRTPPSYAAESVNFVEQAAAKFGETGDESIRKLRQLKDQIRQAATNEERASATEDLLDYAIMLREEYEDKLANKQDYIEFKKKYQDIQRKKEMEED